MNANAIAHRIVEAILAQRLSPGTRLGEQALAMLFDCSRTLVREAMMQLTARGIVTVSARRGWYVVQPSTDDAREAFEARQVIETGLIRAAKPLGDEALQRLHTHIAAEQAAIASDDVGQRSFLLGDFHVCLAECLGNQLLADTLRDFTARTTLIAMLYQSTHDASASCQDHVDIVDALARGDTAAAEALMAAHIGQVQDALHLDGELPRDPLDGLRQALSPLRAATASHSPHSATYLGALL